MGDSKDANFAGPIFSLLGNAPQDSRTDVMWQGYQLKTLKSNLKMHQNLFCMNSFHPIKRVHNRSGGMRDLANFCGYIWDGG